MAVITNYFELLNQLDDSILIFTENHLLIFMNNQAKKEFGEFNEGELLENIFMEFDDIISRCNSDKFGKTILSIDFKKKNAIKKVSVEKTRINELDIDEKISDIDRKSIDEMSNSEVNLDNLVDNLDIYESNIEESNINDMNDDGIENYYNAKIIPYITSNEEKKIIFYIKNKTKEILNEKEINLANERFKDLVDNLPYSIIILDKHKNIFDCNRTSEIYLDLKREELINQNFFDIFNIIDHTKRNEIDEKINYAFDFNLSQVDEFEILNNDTKNWIEIFFSPLIIGESKYVQLIINDTTEKNLAEEIMREENERLRKLDMVKNNMTASLQSPLTALSNASKMLLETYGDKLDPNAVKLLQQINLEGEQSIDMIGKMVDLSRIGSEDFELNLQIENLKDIIDEFVIKLRKEIKTEKPLNVKIYNNKNIFSKIDKKRFYQTIKDLTNNYIKNLPEEHSIIIKTERFNDFAVISVSREDNSDEDENLETYSDEIPIEYQFANEIIDLHKGSLHLKFDQENNLSTIKILLPIIKLSDEINKIYIIHQHGTPLYICNLSSDDMNNTDNSCFNLIESESDDSEKISATIISGGIVGILSMLKEIMKGNQAIKSIDHGDQKLMFEVNRTKEVYFIIHVKNELDIFRKQLIALVSKFDEEFKDLVDNIKNSCSDILQWSGLGKLIQEYFGIF